MVYKVVRGAFGHYNVTDSLPLTRVRLLKGARFLRSACGAWAFACQTMQQDGVHVPASDGVCRLAQGWQEMWRMRSLRLGRQPTGSCPRASYASITPLGMHLAMCAACRMSPCLYCQGTGSVHAC